MRDADDGRWTVEYGRGTVQLRQLRTRERSGSRSIVHGLWSGAKGAAVVLAAIAAYASTPFNFWVGDDYNYIFPKSIERVIGFFDPTVPTGGFYRPLNWTILAI